MLSGYVVGVSYLKTCCHRTTYLGMCSFHERQTPWRASEYSAHLKNIETIILVPMNRPEHQAVWMQRHSESFPPRAESPRGGLLVVEVAELACLGQSGG